MSSTPGIIELTVLEVAVALAQIVFDQVAYERLGVLVEGAREPDFSGEDVLIDLHRVVGGEGVNA